MIRHAHPDLVEQGALLEGNAYQVPACLLHSLLNGCRNFTCLAIAESESAIAVTYNSKSGERHDAAALDDLRYTVDVHQLFLELAVLCICIVISSHNLFPPLEL